MSDVRNAYWVCPGYTTGKVAQGLLVGLRRLRRRRSPLADAADCSIDKSD